MKPLIAVLLLLSLSCTASRDADGWRFALDIANAAKAIRVINQK